MERILVVEDDLALSTGLCFELDNAGYLTVAAYNCTKARYLLEHENFSLALLDVNLPDGNGFDLCREIKAVRPELPVIFLTANDLETDVLNGFDMGAEDYVTKPFNMQILLRRVEVALRRAGSATAAPAASPMTAPMFLASCSAWMRRYRSSASSSPSSNNAPVAARPYSPAWSVFRETGCGCC